MLAACGVPGATESGWKAGWLHNIASGTTASGIPGNCGVPGVTG